MNNSLINIGKEFIKVIIVAAIAVPTVVLFAAWTGPSGSPPNNNAEPPINVSDNAQEKKGDLTIHRSNGGFDVGLFTTDILSVIGGAIFNKNNAGKEVTINTEGNVGIGTISPTEKLDVAGRIKISNDNLTTPESGTIRWTGIDFEGYTGTAWVSLTAGGMSNPCPAPRQLVLLRTQIICLQEGAYTEAASVYCSYVGPARGEGRFRGGKFQIKLKLGRCDTGWVDGLTASCTGVDAWSSAELTPRGVSVSLSVQDDDSDAGPNTTRCTGEGLWP